MSEGATMTCSCQDKRQDGKAYVHTENYATPFFHLEHAFTLIRPRLLRIARKYGIPQDQCEDIVQDTFIAAWLHMHQLLDSEKISSWLERICRNQCSVYLRTQYRVEQRKRSQASFSNDSFEREDAHRTTDAFDQCVFDPWEALCRKEAIMLLNRALSMLERDARELCILSYCTHLSAQEVAQRSGLSVKTLRVRLHRVRQQLRAILNAQLRHEAEACGFPLDPDLSAGWQATGEWCPLCGQHQLRGALERSESGRVRALRMRCPGCSPRSGGDIVRYIPPASQTLLHGRRTLKPAVKELNKHHHQQLGPYILQAFTADSHPCFLCTHPVQVTVPGLDTPVGLPCSIQLQLTCPSCGCHFSVGAGELLCTVSSHPIIQQFLVQAKRRTIQPDMLVHYKGATVCRFHFIDLLTAQQLILLARPDTLEIIDVIMISSPEESEYLNNDCH